MGTEMKGYDVIWLWWWIYTYVIELGPWFMFSTTFLFSLNWQLTNTSFESGDLIWRGRHILILTRSNYPFSIIFHFKMLCLGTCGVLCCVLYPSYCYCYSIIFIRVTTSTAIILTFTLFHSLYSTILRSY